MLRQKTSVNNNIISQFITEVEFGAPSKDCRNFGICRIHVISKSTSIKEYNLKSCKCNHACALISFTNHQNIEMIFFKNSLSSKSIHKFFHEKYFKVEEDFYFNSSVQPKHSFSDCKIKKGAYPIIETIGSYIVVF